MMQPVIRKNHMDIAWHEYTDENGADIPVTQASLTEKHQSSDEWGLCFCPVEQVHGESEVR